MEHDEDFVQHAASPPTEVEMGVLNEMLSVASSAAATDRTGGRVNLLRMMSAYEIVLERHGLAPIEDTRFYQLLLNLSMMPESDWSEKLAAMWPVPAHAARIHSGSVRGACEPPVARRVDFGAGGRGGPPPSAAGSAAGWRGAPASPPPPWPGMQQQAAAPTSAPTSPMRRRAASAATLHGGGYAASPARPASAAGYFARGALSPEEKLEAAAETWMDATGVPQRRIPPSAGYPTRAFCSASGAAHHAPPPPPSACGSYDVSPSARRGLPGDASPFAPIAPPPQYPYTSGGAMTHAPGTTASLYSEGGGRYYRQGDGGYYAWAGAEAAAPEDRQMARAAAGAEPWQLRAHASQLRAALQFDQRRMDPLEAAAYARFRVVAAIFRAWRDAATAGAAEQAAFDAAVKRWLRAVQFWEERLMLRVWRSWRKPVQETIKGREQLLRSLHHFGMRLSHSHFVAWVDLHRKRKKLRKSANHFRGMSATQQAITAWRGVTAAARAADALQGKASKFYRKEQLHEMMEKWATQARAWRAILWASGDTAASSTKGAKRGALAKLAAHAVHQKKLERAFVKVIKAEKQDLEAMRRAALKFRNVGLSRALTTWAVWGAQRALYKQNAFLLASHHAGVVSQLVLVAWREAVKSNHRLRDNVVESLRLTRSKHALRHLRLGIEASKEQGRKALRLMASGELRSIRAALVKWMEIISEADAAREKMWGAVGRMRNTKLAAGFLGWLGAVEAIATAKALMALCVRTFINKAIASAWRSWMEFVGDCHLMRKCVLSFMHRALAGSVRAWAQMADEGARKAAVMGGALGRLRNRDWARALIQWVAYTDETLRVKGVLDGVGRKRAFSIWVRTAAELKVSTARIRKAFGFMRNRVVSMVFNSWTGLVTERKTLRQQLLPIANRIAMRLATLTFGAWCEFLGQVKENRQKVARAAAMWTGGLLLRCFLGFDRYRKQRILHRERNELAAYTAAVGCARAHLGAWRGAYAAKTQDEARMRKAVGYMVNGATARALSTWAEITRDEKARVAAIGNVVARWRLGALGAGWNTWAEGAAAKKRAQESGTRALLRLRQREKFSGFAALRDHAEETHAALARLGAAALALRNRHLKACWNSWSEEVELGRRKAFIAGLVRLREARGAIAKWAEGGRQWRLMQRVAGRVANRAVGASWAGWHAYWRECVGVVESAQARALECAGKMLHHAVNRGFRALQENVQAKAELRAVLRRIAYPKLGAMWNSWAEFAYEGVERERKLRRSLMAITHGTSLRCFGAWWRLVELRRAVKAKVAKLLGGMLNATFGGWARWAAEEGKDRRAYEAQQAVIAELDEAAEERFAASVVRWQHSYEARGFDGWADAFKTKLRKQICNDLAMRFCTGAILQWAFGVYAYAVRLQLMERAAAGYWGMGGLRKAWNSWREKCNDGAALRSKAALAIAHACMRLESLVIQGWRGVALYWRNKRLGTLAAGLHYEGALVLTHFRGWLSLVHRRRYLEERVATGLGLTTSAFLSRNLREWHKAARTLALQRLAVGAKFDRSVAARIAGAWTSWLSFSAKFGWMRRATGGFSRASQLRRGWRLMGGYARSREERMAKMGMVLGKTEGGLKLVGLRTWASNVAEANAAWAKLQAAGGAFVNKACRAAWNTLMGYCSEQLAMRARARAALHRLTNLATARGWSQWTAYADARSEALRKVRMAVGRARNALVAAAFGAFALFLQDVLAKKAKARADADQMLLRIMNREVWLGFRCFDQVWQAAKVERKMRKAVGRMRHRHQSRALMAWRHEYYAYKVGLGIINREMTALGTALRKWHEIYARWSLVTRCFVTSTRRDTRYRLYAWRDQSRRRAQLGLRQRYVARRRDFYARRLYLHEWSMVAAGERFAKRGAHRRGFEKIAAAAGHRASRKHARLRALSKYAFSISYRCFVAWLEHARVAVGVRRELERQHQNQLALEHHRSRARARLLYVTYTGWHQLAAQTVELKRLSESAHLMLCKSRAFESWKLRSALGQHTALLVGSAFAFARDRGLGAAMSVWRYKAAVGAKHKGIALVLCGRREYGALLLALRAWRAAAVDRRRLASAVSAALGTTEAGRVRLAFRRLSGHALKARGAHRLTFSRAQRQMLYALSQLRANQAVARKRLAKAATVWGSNTRGGSFRRWAARAARPRRDEMAEAYFLHRLQGVVFFHWRLLSWSRNWEKPGRYSAEQQRQKALAMMIVRGPVAHQRQTARAFKEDALMTPSRSPMGSRAGSSRGGSPLAGRSRTASGASPIGIAGRPASSFTRGGTGIDSPSPFSAARRPPPSAHEDPLLAAAMRTAASSAGKSAAHSARYQAEAYGAHATSIQSPLSQLEKLSTPLHTLPFRPARASSVDEASDASGPRYYVKSGAPSGAVSGTSSPVPGHMTMAYQFGGGGDDDDDYDDEAASPPRRLGRRISGVIVDPSPTLASPGGPPGASAGMSVGLALGGMIMGGADAGDDDSYEEVAAAAAASAHQEQFERSLRRMPPGMRGGGGRVPTPPVVPTPRGGGGPEIKRTGPSRRAFISLEEFKKLEASSSRK